MITVKLRLANPESRAMVTLKKDGEPIGGMFFDSDVDANKAVQLLKAVAEECSINLLVEATLDSR